MKEGQALLAAHPGSAEAWLMMARAAQQLGDFAETARYCARAFALAPQRADARLMQIESDLYCGETARAKAVLKTFGPSAGDPPAAWQRVVKLLTEVREYEAAYAIAARLAQGGSVGGLSTLAGAAVPLGRMEEVEGLAGQVLALAPEDGETAYTRATLRRQTAASNHIGQLRTRLASLPTSSPVEAGFCYALAKELEDLGEYEQSFDMLARGAAARRQRLSYDVAADEAAIADIIAIFDGQWAERAPAGDTAEGPIFVLGLPRSGTTLVDRILSSHSAVESLGELNDLTFAIMFLCGRARGKRELMERAAACDPAKLGAHYWRAVRGYGVAKPYVIDKTPLNYLYLGLIAKALPNARIVHVQREPMASGYAMFKTLFRMGYPFSYDQSDLGRYIAAYRRLMDHWREIFPCRIIEVSYERLVEAQELETRALIAACGLEWDDACLRFEDNKAAVASASAAQVRQPLYGDAREVWRRYESRLAPMREAMQRGSA